MSNFIPITLIRYNKQILRKTKNLPQEDTKNLNSFLFLKKNTEIIIKIFSTKKILQSGDFFWIVH